MSTSFGLPSLLALVLFLLSISLYSARFSVKVKSAEIKEICSKTKNPSFCIDVLHSNPKTPSVDLFGLAQISIDLAGANATDTYNFLGSLVKSTTDPQLKERYLSCHDNYDEAIGDLDQASANLKIRDPDGVNIAASAVMSQVEDCLDNFQQPPADPSSLPQKNQNLNNIANIILIISKLLPQKD